MTEDFPPINYSAGGEVRGMAVEVVRSLMARVGAQQPIEVMPWARSFREAQSGGAVALFSVARTPDREHLFQWVGPIVNFQTSLFAVGRSCDTIQLAEAREAQAVLVVKGWYTDQLLTTAGFKNLLYARNPHQAIRMLQAGRAPLFCSEKLTTIVMFEEMQINGHLCERYAFAPTSGYIAFSLRTPRSIVAAWERELIAMKRDGSFQAIYKQWLPNEKPPV